MRARTRVRARAIAALALVAMVGAVGLGAGARHAAAGIASVHVKITLTGNGRGHLETSDGYINCVRSGGITSGKCEHDYDVSGGMVFFAYVYGSEADSCYVTFSDCITGGLGPSGFLGPESPDQLISIEFRLLEPVLVTVKKAGDGSGTVKSTPRGINCGGDCKSDFAKGSTFTLKATAKSGSKFAGWIGGPCDGQGSTCTFTIGAGPHTVFATFDKKVTATPTPKVTAPPPTEAPVVTEGPTPIVPTPFPSTGPTPTAAPVPTSAPPTEPASDDSGRSTLILALGSLLLIILAAGGLYAMRSRRVTSAAASAGSGAEPLPPPPPPPPVEPPPPPSA